MDSLMAFMEEETFKLYKEQGDVLSETTKLRCSSIAFKNLCMDVLVNLR